MKRSINHTANLFVNSNNTYRKARKGHIATFLMAIFLLAGGVINEAWAGDVKYHIVNKSGETPVYKTVSHNAGAALTIPDGLKSPYIKSDDDYKYFKSAGEAQAYILNGTADGAITACTDDLTEVYIGYRYEEGYTPEGLPVLAKSADEAIRYHVRMNNYPMYAERNSGRIPKLDTSNPLVIRDEASAVFQYMFISDNCDPYDMKIVSPFYPDGWMHSNSALNSDNQFYMDKPATTYTAERFFFSQSSMGCAVVAVMNPHVQSTTDIRLAYLTQNGNGIRLSNIASVGASQIMTSFKPLSLFHIIKKDGSIAVSAYSSQQNLSSGLPAVIKSPVLEDSNYCCFRTLKEAQDYTDSPTEANAQNAIGEEETIEPGSIIYVGYDYVNNPQKMDLDGTRWYRIRGHEGNDILYFSKEPGDTGSPAIKSYNKSGLESTFASTLEYTMFKFEGNDPYDLMVRNGYLSASLYAFPHLTGDGIIKPAVWLTSDKETTFHLMLLNHTDGYSTLTTYVDENSYQHVGQSAGYTGQPTNYLKAWCAMGGIALLSGYSTKYNPQSCYYSEENYSKLSFEPVQFETTFHIIDKSGREAISYTGMFDADMPLNYDNLPAAIRSPYLEKETLTFKDMGGNVIERTPMTKGTDIYVTYTTDHLAENPITLSNTDIANYNLIVNGQYVYEANGAIVCGANEDVAPNYLWNLMGEDPYAVKIRNVSVSDKLLAFDTTSGNLSFDNGSNFILMSGKDGKYEIVAATGGNVNADTNPYNIGYSAADGIKLYNDYAQGADEIQAQLEVYKPGVTYHIIDKQNKEVLSKYIEDQMLLGLPEEIISPLVTQYHYWKKEAFTLDNEDNPTTFILKEGQTEITSVAEATVNKKTDVYVTYDVNETLLSTSEEIANGNRKKYRLNFLDEQNKNVYPYANENIGIGLLGDEVFEADTKRSAITRPNWGWYLESDLKDPYHVKIASAAQYESWNEGVQLYMYTANGKTSATTNTPTDYMLLGAEGAYKLAFGNQDNVVNSFETNNVGDGAFSITELILQPTLILLDRHGWEIMRKPLPAAIGKDDVIEPDLDAINAYNSPMVKGYKFYRNATKLKGYHKFEVSDPIMEAGQTYTATSLTGLPTSYYSMGDNIYVTYDVKEEYEKTYRTDAPTNYLIQQGDAYATATEGANAIALTDLPANDIPENMLWHVKPNLDIDKEMGYDGKETYDNVFDPYNLQIQNVAYSTYFTTNATGAKVGETASMEGTYPGTGMTVTLTNGTFTVEGAGQGGVKLRMTNATFMAVLDADGNMHLMPRFDHSHVISGVNNEITLAEPSAAAEQITQLQRLLMYTYIIVDNSGHEALRYKGKVGEEYPQIPSLLKSPMAKDFKFYQKFDKLDDETKNLRSISLGTYIPFYDGKYSLEDIANKEITGSFIAAGISSDTQPIYVRYAYDEEGDTHHLLSEGDWHHTAIGDNTTGNGEGDAWKFIRNATTEDPDPYNVVLYHREGNTASDNHYAFLANGDGLSLVLARKGSTSEYEFLSNLETGNTEKIEGFAENGYTDNESQSQVKITFKDVIFNSPKYYIITNDGTLALIAKSHHEKASDSPYLPDWARSPLLNDGDYLYYADATIEEDGKYTIAEADRTNNLCGLPQDIVYVRYNYNKETTPLMVADTWVRQGETWNNINYSTLDITGGTWYNMEYDFLHYSGGFVPSLVQARDGNGTYYESRNRDNNVVDVDKKGYILDFSRDSITGYIGVQSSEKFMFKLDGGDPYAIKIYNLYKYNQDKETECLLSIYQNENASQLMYFLEEGKGYQSFMLLQKENEKKEYRHLLVATSHPNYYVKLRDHNDNQAFAFKVLSATSTDADLQEESGDLLEDLLTYKDVSAMRFYKAPSIGYYTFHGIRYNDEGTAPYSFDENGKPKVTWTAKLHRSWLTQVKIEEDLVRLFTFYEKENSTNEFVSSTEAGIGRFYSNQELTEPVYDKTSRTTENVYPQIDKEDNYDIYFKYTVASEELGELTSTWEDVAKDVKAYYAADATKGKLRKGSVNAKWNFMVLDTDENITTDADGNTVGEQYFLFRRDDGKVGWMNNDYALHKNDNKNYNNWSYNRLAEWYRQGDNDVFREGRWLWTFIGDDPYNIHIINMESAVGVIPEAQGVYALEKGEECYTIVTEEIDEDGNKTYPVSIPMEKPESNYGWGLCPGYGSENTFSLQLPMTDDKCYPLYWRMATDNDKPDSVTGMAKENNRSAAIQLLRYIPVAYEDVNLTIRRDDEVDKYKNGDIKLDKMVTGISKLYFAESERMFAAGDEIDTQNLEMLPLSVRRAFCNYKFYSDDFYTEGGKYIVKAGPYPDYSKPQLDQDNDTLRDEDGKIIYNYYYVDETGATTPADGPQSIYASYTVTSDMFLTKAPSEAEVKAMVENNDHVFFMEFPGTDEKGQPITYDTGHHAYYEENATFRDEVGDLTKKIDANKGRYIPEKRKWENGENVDDTETLYNHCQFKTTSNRLTSMPQNLKWYFVGDPYKVQVYCAAGKWGSNNDKDKEPEIVAANLCRFDETETNFQFVVDCVHLRVPDYSNKDRRRYVRPTDEDGKELDPVPNKGYNKPYFDDFYWEVVPAASKDEETFALRFKEDNDLLGYRNVYYYLAHDGLRKQYRTNGENTTYNINLSYDTDNALQQSGDYKGYHKANNNSTIIKLVQPVKVYMGAYKSTTNTSNLTVKDELSEYYGFGEPLKEVPRHLQRKFASYNTAVTYWDASSTERSVNFTNLKLDNTYKYSDKVYRFAVKYSTANGIFTSEADYNNNNINWLDASVGGSWLYYDKIDGTNDKVSNYKNAVAHSDANGWNDGLKGLHWAFIGDPYDFTIVNRRKHNDNEEYKLLAAKKISIDNFKEKNENDSIIWTTSLLDVDNMPSVNDRTSEKTANADINTHWSLQMWKTGENNETGNTDNYYFLRTASLKTTNFDYNCSNDAPDINQTNNYWRMVAKQYSDNDLESAFVMVPYSLSNRSVYNNDVASSNYSQTMNGLGVTQHRFEVRTVTAEDNDGAKNDCFDATIRVVSEAGDERIKKEGVEVRYLDYLEYEDKKDHGDPVVLMPNTLKRYGCTYKCYRDYEDASNPGTLIEDFNSDEFKDYVKTNEPITLTYVYKVTDEVSQFFTSQENAAMEEFTWLFAYYMWQQSFSGTNVEVEITEKVFDHYVYNAEGKIIDEVYKEVKRTEIVQNPSDPFDLSSYLNSHSQQSSIYSDESRQSDDGRLKWCLVGDPYSFTMTNYAQYLENMNSALTSNGNSIVASNLEAAQFTIIVGEDGKTYLAIVDPKTGDYTLITFDNSATSDKSLTIIQGSGINNNDPTGNSINISNVKEFFLTGLFNYANLVTYHLVMAHQYSLDDYKDTDLTTEQKEDVKNRLYEFLKYWGLYTSDKKDHYLKYENDKPSDYNKDLETVIKKLLRRSGTLRDLVNYPIPDAEVSRVGIGIRPAVPWYMRRQFCTYTMYQRDVQQAVNDEPVYEEADQEWKDNGGKTIPIDGIEYKVDENGKRIQKTYVDENGVTQFVYNIRWVSIFDESQWVEGEKPSGYAEALALQDHRITQLKDCHKDRHVIIDLLYDVSSNQFRFAADGRNSTAWYQMQNQGNDGALMNFSYTNGIGTKTDPAHHYTNDYLWAPEGDPYGFVLRSRYATNNGTGWDDVAVTTTNALPENEKDNTEAEDEKVTYTSITNDENNISYDRKQIVQQQNEAKNAVYEMFPGNYLHPDAFVMHPTSAWLDTDNTNTPSFYVVYSPGTTNSDDIGDTDDTDGTTTTTSVPAIKLTYGSLADIKNNPNANWKLIVTAEQLLPYFDRSGYVGGLTAAKAQSFTNMDIRNQLRSSISNGTQPDFKLLSQAQEVVYSGTFIDSKGNEVTEEGEEDEEEPTALPLTFQATNLVNMNKGYYRIKAFSEDALNSQEETIKGVVGPRYVSGYRFESEKESALNLHLFETSMDNATIHTFGALSEISNKTNEQLTEHSAMQGNIELLPADFDPSSIFHFNKKDNSNSLYSLHTQELAVNASGEKTKLVGADSITDFFIEDIGGTAITLRTLTDGNNNSTLNEIVEGIKSHYININIDSEARYDVAYNKPNEGNEGNKSQELEETSAGVQTTKWLLQPVGINEAWPYNEMPLRVEVHRYGNDEENNPKYYGSLYVPFDTRMGRTTDGAFTMTSTPNLSDKNSSTTLILPSVSRLNEIGNPQYVPAGWEVLLRTDHPSKYDYKIEDEDYSKYYVDMYLPYSEPRQITKPEIKLEGSYLEKTLDIGNDTTVMVFGAPYKGNSHDYDFEQQVGLYVNDNWAREKCPNKTAQNATDEERERNNKYVYHNKVYYILNMSYEGHQSGSSSDARQIPFIVTIFDGDDMDTDSPEEEESEYFNSEASDTYPCDVYDLQGRRVARNETPETLRHNHPGLPKGVYIFGNKKVVVK